MRSLRRPLATLAVLAFLAFLGPGASAVATPAPERVEGPTIEVSPGCSVPVVQTLPTSPADPADCQGRFTPSGPVTAVSEDPVPCAAQVVPLVDNRCEAWTARYDGPVRGPDQPHGELGGARLVASSNETIFAAGLSDSNPSTAAGWAGLDMDVVVAAHDSATGQSRWSFKLPAPEQTYAENIVADPDRDLVYVSTADYEDVGDCVRHPSTVALDQASGAHAWTARESAPNDACLAIRTTAVDPAGERVFLVGNTEVAGKPGHVLIARDADSGSLLWRAFSSSAGGETGTVVAPSPDGSVVYSAGSVLSDDGGFLKHVAWAIRGYDAATGEPVLNSRWDAPTGPGAPNTSTPMNPPADMAVSPDGASLYLTGGVDHVPGRFFDITVLAVDSGSGQPRWMYRYDGPRQKSSFDSVWYNGALALSRDGSKLAIAGYSTHLVGANLQLDLATVLINTADGSGLWVQRYTAENETNWVPTVAMSPDATRVYVAAPSRYAVQWELPARYTTLAYSANDGSVSWIGRYSEGHSFAMGSTLTPDGKRFVVTGMTAPAGQGTLSGVNWDIGLAAYATD